MTRRLLTRLKAALLPSWRRHVVGIGPSEKSRLDRMDATYEQSAYVGRRRVL